VRWSAPSGVKSPEHTSARFSRRVGQLLSIDQIANF
jgi:hypothetical protein